MTQRLLFRCAFLLLSCTIALGASAQVEFNITGGSGSGCVGVIQDSGGPSADYGDNENYTFTICPDVPGNVIYLTWFVFNLSTAGTNDDNLTIYDGDNTSALSLGSYTGTQLQNLIVSGTVFNTTGCLTLVFQSNNTGVGNFSAGFQCTVPCQNPTSVATMTEPVPALVCQGETISFDGTGSTSPAGTIVQYLWDFDDGSLDSTTGPNIDHSFADAGEYVVQLFVTDDNDCGNLNLVDLQILVSTTPSFQGTMESVETCLGATVDLFAVATPITWTGIPDANFGDGIFLPDDVGQPFTSSLLFTQFNPGQTVTSTTDIISICVEMEHTYMGDLVLQVICPNGQTMIFHQQGGGYTYIGSPNDFDTNQNPVIGECWEYCWSPTATNGTWVDNSVFGTSNTTLAGTPPSQSLNAGTYEPVQPFSNLIGCPLNGSWTYQSTDLWGADNGFICSWSINFNPAIVPDVTQFTPDLGTVTLDSAYWSGPNLVNDPNDPLLATASPTAPGTFNYQFFVTDNFGCTYDTTIFVTVADQMVIDAGPDIVLCNNPEPMAGVVVANGPPTNCVWTLVLEETFGDSWNGGANLNVTINGVSTIYTVPAGVNQLIYPLNVSTGSTISLFYTAGSVWNNENSFYLNDDLGATVYDSPQGPPTGMAWSGVVSCGGGTSPTTWQWTPAAGLDDATDPLTNVLVTSPTWYYLSAWPAGSPACAVTDSVLVSPDPSIDAGLPYVMTVCASDPIFLMTDSLGGTPDAGGIWTTSGGAVVTNSFDPNTGATDVYTYTVTSSAGCVATSTLDITVIPADDPTCCGVADAGLPAYSCDLTIALSATPGNTGVGQWSGPAGSIFGNATDPITTVTVQPGMGGTHRFYWIEDDGAFCYLIDSVDMTFTDEILIDFATTDAICYTYCDGTAQAAVTGGNAVAGFTFDWTSGDNGVGVDAVQGLCAGPYYVTVTDDNGCAGTDSLMINEPVLLEIDSLAMQPVTCSGDCDGQVEVYDAEAVEWSFDDGLSWLQTNVLPDQCEAIYPIRIRDAAGCIGTGAIEVTGPPPVVADFTWNPIPANVNDPRIWFANTSTGAQTWWWDIAGFTTSTEMNPYFRFSEKEPGQYEVCLAAFNYNQCADTICKTVIIDDVLFVYVPNSFTPDGDNLNETWGMSTNIDVITSFTLRVFDRWGEVIFETEDPYEFWNGAANNSGEILKTEVYVYRIAFEIRGTEVRKELLGHVTLIK
ncbi:MAG: gliding motility-associated C-terminal domain-containing protein [Flavobacteriales bacterium]|nr:gliding motility-associated C-terminal domain-containing protein [Flavobacteriales bacterium]